MIGWTTIPRRHWHPWRRAVAGSRMAPVARWLATLTHRDNASASPPRGTGGTGGTGGDAHMASSMARMGTNADAQRDPRAAVDALYRQHAPAVFSYLTHHLPSVPDAEDALAEVFIAALRTCAQGDVPDLPWLLLVARRRIADFYRWRLRRASPGAEEAATALAGALVEDDGEDPEAAALAAEERRELLHMVARLPREQRDVLALRFVAELRSPAIAAMLGKSDEAIRAILSRAVRRLRKEWDQ